jgi:hypothetical protein
MVTPLGISIKILINIKLSKKHFGKLKGTEMAPFSFWTLHSLCEAICTSTQLEHGF